MAERGGFEPPRRVTPTYRFSKPDPSASWVPLREWLQDKGKERFEQEFYKEIDSFRTSL